jgi:hypothetical protein
MAHYKADVWLGSNSGMQTVEVNSSSYSGVVEQICNIYNVSSDKIRNIREVSNTTNNNTYSDDSGGTLTLIGLCIFVWLFISYTPGLLMGTFGWGSAWGLTKLAGKTTDELLDKKNRKLYHLIVILSLFCGGVGMVWGDKIQHDYFTNPPEKVAK